MRCDGSIGEDDDIVTGVNSFAFLTFSTLVRTASGVTSPTTVTFLAANSILNEVTPEIYEFFLKKIKKVVVIFYQ